MLVVVGLNVSMELCLVLTVLDLVGFLFYCHRAGNYLSRLVAELIVSLLLQS